jgi:hypothetical protein
VHMAGVARAMRRVVVAGMVAGMRVGGVVDIQPRFSPGDRFIPRAPSSRTDPGS